MKKKLLYIVEAFGGGVFTYIVDLCNNLKERYDITVAYANREETPDDIRKYINGDIQLIELKHAQRSIHLKNDILFMAEIRRIVSSLRPDIVHLHSSKAGFAGRLVINCKKTPVFYTPHGYSFMNADGGGRQKRMYWYLEKMAAKSHAVTIGVSETEYEAAKELSPRSTYVSNGINIDNLPIAADPDVDYENLKIATLARITRQKNPELFSDIACQVPDAAFTWIGDGELASLLQADNIKITGWLSRKDAVEALQKQDIFLLTSLWEGLPIALLEAMYLKKICIVRNIPGTKEVIRHGENGFVVDELSEYVDIINNIMLGRYNLKKIAAQAHDDVCNIYNVNEMARRYVGIYEDALKGAGEVGA